MKTVVTELLHMGNRFAYGEQDFQWVAEDLLLKGLLESRRILNDENQMTATALYWTGKLYARSERKKQIIVFIV